MSGWEAFAAKLDAAERAEYNDGDEVLGAIRDILSDPMAYEYEGIGWAAAETIGKLLRVDVHEAAAR
jgi:hypothetical protein